MMSEASTGVDAGMRPLTLAIQGFLQEVEPSGMLPNDRLVVPKRQKKKKKKKI